MTKTPEDKLPLLSFTNWKTEKGEQQGYRTGILYLKPASTGGYQSVCPSSSKGCEASCLNLSGWGKSQYVQNGRQRKTDLYFSNRSKFHRLLRRDIAELERYSERHGLTPCVRLNGTSDLPSLARLMAKSFPQIQFYDYTKIYRPWKRTLPNYHITFSRNERNWDHCLEVLKHGMNVSIVFRGAIPEGYAGFPVVSGEADDLRFLDPKGVIVGLRAKNLAQTDQLGFVV